MKNLILSEIWIYPVKSLGGIRLKSARIFEKGLQYDRRWMLVDEHGVFLTQRIHPQMALFKLSINDHLITITFKNPKQPVVHSSVMLDVNAPALGEAIHATIWNDHVETVEVDRRISEWFSEQLQMSCRLVSFPETNARPVDSSYQVNGEQVSLADAYPFLIIGQSTLDDLNNRLVEKLPMNRFRPNFVFTGGEPYEEDTWKNFVIGDNRFVGVKPCARCTLITINQDTTEKGIEPLATLSTYRKKENKVMFGQNLVALNHGTVTEGDAIILDADDNG
jgi:uncharacterized protein YcbX